MYKNFICVLAGLIFTLTASMANAIIVTPTVQELLDGGSITVLDKVFSDWWVNDSSESHPVNWNNVTLDRLNDDPLNPGLAFYSNGEFTSRNINFDLGFTVGTVDGSERIKDISSELKEFNIDQGVGGTVMSMNAYALDTDAATDAITVSNLDAYLFDAVQFTPVASTRVTMDFSVGGYVSSMDRLDIRVSQVSQVPEPATFALMGLGLIGLGFARRKKAA